MDPAPTRIGRYEVLRRLGHGARGTLYLARDPVLERDVAVRLIYEFDSELRDRLERRARAATRLQHPNIATVYEVDEDHGRPFVASEYIDGETLGELIRRRAPLSIERRLTLIEELCDGLGYAHRAGVVHGGIKPANLAITTDGVLKILDIESARAAFDPPTADVTLRGGIIGSLPYMSPEEVQGLTGDVRSDIFSVGLVLYETLSYSRPYPGDSVPELIRGILHTQPTPLSQLAPDIDPALEAAVEKAIQKAPEQRYQKVDDLRMDLARARQRLQMDVGSGPARPATDHEAPVASRPPTAAQGPMVELQKRHALTIETHLTAAQQHFEACEYQRALEDCEAALSIDPDNVRALELLDRARRALDDQRVGDLVKKAGTLLHRGQLEEASQLLQEALLLRPDGPEVLELRRAIDAAGRESAFERRRVADASLERARRLIEAGSVDAAQRYVAEVLALDPLNDEAQALYERARAALEERRHARDAAGQHGKASQIDRNVQFSVFRPPAITPAQWYRMLVFAHLASRRPDARPEEPDPIEEVERRAKTLLGVPVAKPADRVPSLAGIPEEGRLRVVPLVSGIEFDPPQQTFLWLQPVRHVEFDFRADAGMEGRTARGTLTIFLGALIVADIPLAIPVESSVDARERPVSVAATPYRRLFASYSRKDEAIVRQFENYARGLGDEYVRDAISLRAGEEWSSRLCELIDSSDVFQLFWSTNSMESAFVRKEWEHALTVGKPHFIRPVYWELPFPTCEGLPPLSLARLHFAFVGSPTAAGHVPLDLPVEAILERERALALERERAARAAEEERAELARRVEKEHVERLAREEEARAREERAARERAEVAAEMQRREQERQRFEAERERAHREEERARAEFARRADMQRLEAERRAEEQARAPALQAEARPSIAAEPAYDHTGTPVPGRSKDVRPLPSRKPDRLPESPPALRPRSLTWVSLAILSVVIVAMLIRGC